MNEQLEKLELTSMNTFDDRIESIRKIFPEAFKEGRIDFDALQRSLGNWIDPGKERFGLNWPGKAECMKIIQQPTIGTLIPLRSESVNFDTTGNIIIEGDNLEVLKLLQKSYYSKVKMIYIDPPYNTGGEFIYPDNFHEGLQDYLKYSGQVDENGLKHSVNTETDGRYHSKWLNMMYPRLFLARNLLKEDGVIFVSIDDNEVHNLRALMNEIFGEENFVAQIEWQKRYTRSNNTDDFTSVIDHICVYQKSDEFKVNLLARDETANARFTNPDNDPRGSWKAASFLNPLAPDKRPNLCYPITNPITGKVTNPTKKAWRYEKSVFKKLQDENRLYWGKEGTRDVPDIKTFLTEVREGMTPINFWSHQYAGHTDIANNEIKDIFGQKIFDTPKPIQLIKRIIEHGTLADDLILDFFAGSGSTGHAVIEKNMEDNGTRKFILVQLPEKTENTEFPTIAAITRERIKRVHNKMHENIELNIAPQVDSGFKAFSLSSSNFKVWQSNSENIENLGKTLQLFVDHIAEHRNAEDILYELLLKVGYPLTAPVEKLTLASKEIYSISEGALLICLDRNLSLEIIEAMIERLPVMIICLDEGFNGNDQLKVNVVQTIKSHNQNTEGGIVFRVV